MDELTIEELAAAKAYVERHALNHQLLLEAEGTSREHVDTMCQYAMAWWYQQQKNGRTRR